MSSARTDRTVEVGDLSVAYSEAGEGRPVVLVHGLAEDRSTWAVQQRELTGWRTYAYDLRGLGDTSLGSADGTLDQLVADLVGFVETVTGPAVLVGFSLGGTLVLRAAADRPDLVTRAVVLGTSSVVGRTAAAFYGERIALMESGSAQERAAALHEDTAPAIVTATDRLDEVVAARVRAVGEGGGYVNAASAMASINQSPLTPRLGEIRCPVDVVGASDDSFCPRKAADIMVAALPDSTYHEVPAAGHLMNVDNPDGVTAVLRSILEGTDQT
ncbi:alpha/beta hydrolase [Ornithinimicrobium ciconiae]|uniref:Alpha/beta hydrolase n=1 Tax=Ornithinimicrobium ciconiae TaxID=2594265 RepID=A0A516G905_9MICO|nr:alpha/beta hydrolase [Ornithinimicrobium ciconiae]QDO88008.1 alpha/beta hydrolase [Ornithinimicrobium ciconiae]